jgi:alkanesulfonate monooxygenase SsuD/methylene tetrahydromethanopterin reductase-like flavin-dependent oxidoreductase (luciferase family)
VKAEAAAQGRPLDVFTVGVITCKPTMKEAEAYHHHCVVDQADWSAVDQLLALRNIRPSTVSADEFQRQRTNYAHGNSGVPIVGDPDHVTKELIALSRAGLNGIAVSFVNYADELPFFRDEVLPRLEREGLRVPATAA